MERIRTCLINPRKTFVYPCSEVPRIFYFCVYAHDVYAHDGEGPANRMNYAPKARISAGVPEGTEDQAVFGITGSDLTFS